MRVFENEVYEQQRLNIEHLAANDPDDWFYKYQMANPPERRTGFAPVDRKCWRCGKDITEGENAITVKSWEIISFLGARIATRHFAIEEAE